MANKKTDAAAGREHPGARGRQGVSDVDSAAEELRRQTADAQLAYFETLREKIEALARHQAEAYRDYITTLSEIHCGLQEQGIEAYRSLTTKLNEAWSSNEPYRRSLEAFQQYQNLLQEIWQREGTERKISGAYERLILEVRRAQDERDPLKSYTEAYNTFLKAVEDTYNDYGDLLNRLQNAQTDFLKLYREAQLEAQRFTEEAYRTYAQNLQQVLTQADMQRRSEDALRSCAETFRNISEESQSVAVEAGLAALKQVRGQGNATGSADGPSEAAP